MKVACAIVAAGQGTRLGSEWSGTPKALVPILGRPMLYYSMNAFDQISELSQFVIAIPSGSKKDFEKLIRAWGFSHKAILVEGGARRTDSVYNTLIALKDNAPDFVMIHDAARPCISAEMIHELIEKSDEKYAAVLAHAASDTLREISGDEVGSEIDRGKIACLETPQLFPYKKILELHEKLSGDDFSDDTTLFTRAGEVVKLVFHEGSNLKVTYAEEIGAAEGVLFSRGWIDDTEGEE